MERYDFTVDTSPMARTVDTVKEHVNGVTTAVSAMKAAVIAAERTASKTICDNVDKGFYVLMKSQLSQKAVAAYTEMISKETILFQLAKALDHVRRQMQDDYNMICRRYHTLFQALNKALETRVKELDRPAMKIAETKKNLVFDRLKNDSSLLFSAAEETLSVSQTAISGKLKQKTRDTIKTLYESTVENRSYHDKLKRIVFRESAGEQILSKAEKPKSFTRANGSAPFQDNKSYLLPVIFSLTESFLNCHDLIENIYTAQTDKWQHSGPIIAEISSMQGTFNWSSVSTGEKETIKKEFLRFCEQDRPDERTGKEIMRLFEENSWEVLKQ
ncbi:MAG: hypothetical protein LBB80_07245 [Treponema sp.]|jgi:hypothetical protein|nr:hypothetical protein [Treponema sp.]